jgi:hypothetical protein
MSRNGSKAAAPAALETPAGFPDDAVQALSASFTRLLADTFALYIKTKNFHGMSRGRIAAITICCWTTTGADFRNDGRDR